MVWHGFWVLPTAPAPAHSSADCAAPRVAQCKVPFPDAPVPRGRSRTQAVPLLCSSASVALVCIWLSAPVSSCSPPHCCWAQQLSPRCRSSGMGHHCPLPSMTRSGGEGQVRWSGCWSTRSSRPGCSHPARKRGEGGRVIAAVTHQLLSPNKRQRLHSQERARGQGQPG